MELDLRRLEKLLPGRVGRSGSDLWQRGREVFSPEGRTRKPAVVIRPADHAQVAAVMKWAGEAGIRLLVRSGGHSFDSFSNQEGAVMLDMRDLCSVRREADLLHAGPAATNGVVTEALADGTYVLPTGDCPTVGMGGQASGGGFGYVARLHGLVIDRLEKATLVTGTGETFVASPTENADLFWACRGGGGCAGIWTDKTFRLARMNRVVRISLDFAWKTAAEILALYMKLTRSAPRELNLKIKIRSSGRGRGIERVEVSQESGTEPTVHVDGLYFGHEDEVRDLLAEMLRHPSLKGVIVHEKASYHDAMGELVPFDVLESAAPPTITNVRVASDFCSLNATADEIAAMVGFVDELQYGREHSGGCVLIEANNGAAGDVPVDASVYAHREAEAVLQWEIYRQDLPGKAGREQHDEMLNALRYRLRRILTGGRYLNYADVLDTPRHWWGDHADKLRNIADKYDPQHLIVSRLHPFQSTPPIP